MSIIPWNIRTPALSADITRLRDEMDRAFDRVMRDPFAMSMEIEPKLTRNGGYVPPLDISEVEHEITVRAEIPGVATKDVEITVTGNTLAICGKKEEASEKKGENFYQCERRFGSFRRVIELPDTIDPEKVTAESDNGVIIVHVAKKPGTKPRQVEIKPTAKKVPIT